MEPFVKTQAGIEPRTLQPAQRALVLDWLWTNYYGKDKYREDDLLYGWNLYDEQAYIEPAVATPPRPSIGYSYVDRTCDYWQTLRAGRALDLQAAASTSPRSQARPQNECARTTVRYAVRRGEDGRTL